MHDKSNDNDEWHVRINGNFNYLYDTVYWMKHETAFLGICTAHTIISDLNYVRRDTVSHVLFAALI